MPSKSDYYELLGVTRSVNAEDIKRAFRKLAMQHHPDKNPDDDKAHHKFREISEAYQVLSDDQKRAAYDRFGHAAFERGGAGGFDFGGGFSDILNEVCGEFMSAAGTRGFSENMMSGRDVRHDADISLEEAFTGMEKTINITT